MWYATACTLVGKSVCLLFRTVWSDAVDGCKFGSCGSCGPEDVLRKKFVCNLDVAAEKLDVTYQTCDLVSDAEIYSALLSVYTESVSTRDESRTHSNMIFLPLSSVPPSSLPTAYPMYAPVTIVTGHFCHSRSLQ